MDLVRADVRQGSSVIFFIRSAVARNARLPAGRIFPGGCDKDNATRYTGASGGHRYHYSFSSGEDFFRHRYDPVAGIDDTAIAQAIDLFLRHQGEGPVFG